MPEVAREWAARFAVFDEEQVAALVAASGAVDPVALERVDALLDTLDARLRDEGLLPG